MIAFSGGLETVTVAVDAVVVIGVEGTSLDCWFVTATMPGWVTVNWVTAPWVVGDASWITFGWPDLVPDIRSVVPKHTTFQ